jgi:hypothetical protein
MNKIFVLNYRDILINCDTGIDYILKNELYDVNKIDLNI